MQEFGSDFHFNYSLYNSGNLPANANYYAIGRHAIEAIIKHVRWKRVWMPEYFCYEVIDAIRRLGIEIVFYPDMPNACDDDIISRLKFVNGDVLFRVNYFGTRAWRDNSSIPVDVIEDHSHDLTSEWLQRSNADYCIASLRKTLPIPEGAILWSPKQKQLPEPLNSDSKNDLIAYKKTTAMLLKRNYLLHDEGSKDNFRKIFIDSENELDNLNLSGISDIALMMLQQLDINAFYKQKSVNWNYLKENLSKRIEVIIPEKDSVGTPFSLVVKCKTESDRDKLKNKLIAKLVYPAILWSIPNECSSKVKEFGERMLSIHCDARYNDDDIRYLCDIISSILNNDTNN